MVFGTKVCVKCDKIVNVCVQKVQIQVNTSSEKKTKHQCLFVRFASCESEFHNSRKIRSVFCTVNGSFSQKHNPGLLKTDVFDVTDLFV